MSDKGKEEIDVAARWALHYAYEAWAEDAWESMFPDVGEYDLDSIFLRIEGLLPESPSLDEFGEAYRVLEERAGGDE